MSISNGISEQANPSLGQAARVWGKIGVLSFGGPAAQIALMHKEVVEDRGWLSEQQFLNALSFCMLLPGPEAMQLATYVGWRLHGTLGGLVAGLLFVIPGAIVIMAMAAIYSFYGSVPVVEALFYGIKAAVLVIVVKALLKVAKTALGQKRHWAIAGFAFIGIFFFAIPFPLIVFGAGLIGWATVRNLDLPTSINSPMVSLWSTLGTISLWLLIWFVPLLGLLLLGAPEILVQLGRFFSTLAVVSFGGAYAVLAYLAQDAVLQFGWLTTGEMIDALGLAETTPGPLILVTQFVGFLVGFAQGGITLGLIAAILVLWVTFAPSFLWIFAGAPYIEWISSQPKLQGILHAITAAVVGVILNLSVWFALHVLFAAVNREELGALTIWMPNLTTIDLGAVALFGLSCLLAFRFKWSVISILLVVSLVGSGLSLSL